MHGVTANQLLTNLTLPEEPPLHAWSTWDKPPYFEVKNVCETIAQTNPDIVGWPDLLDTCVHLLNVNMVLKGDMLPKR